MKKIEDLLKLNELKDQGIISQEDFEKEKTQLLSDTKANQATKNKTTIDWKNCCFAFLIANLCCIILYTICIYMFGTSDTSFMIYRIVVATIVTVIAMKLETQKYKGGCYPAGLCAAILIFGGLGGMFIILVVWAAVYKFLQIIEGKALLNDKYTQKKQEVK